MNGYVRFTSGKGDQLGILERLKGASNFWMRPVLRSESLMSSRGKEFQRLPQVN